jgi:hypothetical protein
VQFKVAGLYMSGKGQGITQASYLGSNTYPAPHPEGSVVATASVVVAAGSLVVSTGAVVVSNGVVVWAWRIRVS